MQMTRIRQIIADKYPRKSAQSASSAFYSCDVFRKLPGLQRGKKQPPAGRHNRWLRQARQQRVASPSITLIAHGSFTRRPDFPI